MASRVMQMNEELVVVKKRFEDRTMMRTAEADHDHIMHDGRVSKTPRRVEGIWDQDTKTIVTYPLVSTI